MRDYYDGLLNFNSDDPYVFLRHTAEIKVKIQRIESLNLYSGEYEFSLRFGIVGFCGEVHPYIHVSKTNTITYSYSDEDNYVYDMEGLRAAIGADYFDKLKTKRFCFSYGNTDISSWFERGIRRNGFMGNVGPITEDKRITSIFLDNKVAYFSMELSYESAPRDGITVVLYPILKDVQFYRVYDIHSVYQKLEHYLTNELVKPDDPYIAPVPDKIIAESKGFDKFSFRKDRKDKKS